MYSLEIRTLYHGSFYHRMQSMEIHKEVQTIDEMIERDFTFFIYDYSSDLFKGIDKILNIEAFYLQISDSAGPYKARTNPTITFGIREHEILQSNEAVVLNISQKLKHRSNQKSSKFNIF